LLLKDTPQPTDDDIDAAIGQCLPMRAYQRIRAAIKHAAGV
jgi:aerobic-type carbon monoxide dehydrogenase small subunit (CoxS/CutS family)